MKKQILLLAALCLLLVACVPQTVTYKAAETNFPQLVVQADAEVEASPDQLQMRLGVVTEAPEAGVALEQNNRRIAAVMQMLLQTGIGAAEMSTGQFQIRPEWSRPPRPTPANWQREIIGYQVSNELLISTSRVELAGKLLSLAQQAGANQIGGLQFGLADPTAYRQKAIEIATAKAIRKAQTMATAAGVELDSVQSISLNQDGGGRPPMLMMAEARSASVEPVPVVAGMVEVSAGVTIVYRIRALTGSAE